MPASSAVRCIAFISTAVAGLYGTAQAQTIAWGSQGGSDNAAPSLRRGYLGLNLGRSNYGLVCSNTSLTCDDAERSVQLYTGTVRGNHWGVEVGLLDLGRTWRATTAARSQGLNLSLVGRAPLFTSRLGVYGKVGTTYGFTDGNPAAGSVVARSATETGLGLSYGAGLSMDFTPRLSATLGWDAHDFRFAGNGREPVRATSLGLQYRY